MQLLRTLLRPGWLLTTVLVLAFAAACFLILAPWQLGKNSETEHRNELLRSATQIDAVPLEELVAPGRSLAADDEWREVRLTGRYLPDEQIMMRLRSVNERPAAEFVTPFQLAGTNQVVLVDRGWVRPGADGVVAVPGAPDGQITIDARLRKSQGTSPGKEPRYEDGRLTAYTLDTAQLSRISGTDFAPYYLQLTPDQPGGLGVIDLPQMESGPYLSYGLQWLAFGIMAPLGVGYFIWAEVKHRRALRAAEAGGTGTADTAAAGAGPDPHSRAGQRKRIREELRDVSTAGTAEPRANAEVGTGIVVDTDDDDVQAKLARRYGR
ncbi:hypothetical protein GOHSU_16_00370 [Gordonia hirsuta DSM 44140 = NBRC 16056]|uniref:SURF1-like protein n=1 Tax=Gordonia hirsuta DSM 44140 = NBRC 16056 TaxID=1121927 RepID=L7L7F8_9ACTN|nr:SURF1 family cytochrome oxidase biogenesis protein [Gordonia hirsuta]GAC57080.1 hypothetical protein GOHSU_16_00370 [Gordonia hirsuta DSM 44140 = NBRC 16056]